MRTAKQLWTRLVALALCCISIASGAASPPSSTGADISHLADMSIEELMNETITSVSKHEQVLSSVAAALTVLSNDDLRRSGATNVADVLRMVPGMDVGSVTASEWAISARGFNNLYANKLLVLVDGRAVYAPIFAGVYWDLQQVMLEDIDRIEIIRGPGATMWGANAVNGVINIVTRSARETQQGLAYAGGGSANPVLGGARYGGQLAAQTYYRVYGGYQDDGNHYFADGSSARDNWQASHGGFRIDHYANEFSQLTWQADLAQSQLDAGQSSANNFNTLMRWSQHRSDRSSIEVQAYYDRTERDEATRTRNSTSTYDLSLQSTHGIGEQNDVIWGAGYRYIDNTMEQTNFAALVRKPTPNLKLYSAFIQDEYKLVPQRLNLTAGLKLEHNEFTGYEAEPTVRAAFKPNEQATLWAAISRAVRTPDLIEGRNTLEIISGGPFQGPDGKLYLPAIVGNPAARSEVLWAYELGYRVQLTPRLNVDAASYYNHYDNLISYGNIQNFVPGAPFGIAQIPWSNALHAQTYGGEMTVTLAPKDRWRLIGEYSLLFADVRGPASGDVIGHEQSAPRHQLSLRSSYDFTVRTSFNIQARYVGSILMVPAYTTADIQWLFRPVERIELAVVGQNLLQRNHAEQAAVLPFIAAEVPRSAYAKLSWRF